MKVSDKTILENYVYELAKHIIKENNDLINNFCTNKKKITEASESQEISKIQNKKVSDNGSNPNGMINGLKDTVEKAEKEDENYKDSEKYKKLDGVVINRLKSDPKLSFAALAYAIYRNEGALLKNIHEIPKGDRDGLRSRFSQSLNHTNGKSFSAKELTMLAKLVQSS